SAQAEARIRVRATRAASVDRVTGRVLSGRWLVAGKTNPAGRGGKNEPNVSIRPKRIACARLEKRTQGTLGNPVKNGRQRPRAHRRGRAGKNEPNGHREIRWRVARKRLIFGVTLHIPCFTLHAPRPFFQVSSWVPNDLFSRPSVRRRARRPASGPGRCCG